MTFTADFQAGFEKSYTECNTGIDSWPQFVVMQGKTVSFKQMSPISFAKFLVQTLGEPETGKRLQNKSYLVKYTSQEHSDKFLSISQIGTIDVATFFYASLNAIKGVITSENLCKNSDEEVPEWLTMRNFLVRSIHRFPIRQTPDCTAVQTASSCTSYPKK